MKIDLDNLFNKFEELSKQDSDVLDLLKKDLSKEKEDTKAQFQRLLDVFGATYDSFECKDTVVTQIISWI
jgi:hypothetical protein